MNPTHGGTIWSEQAGAAITAAVKPAAFELDAGAWSPVESGIREGAAFDLGDGDNVLLDLTTEPVIISDGSGGFVTAASGTEALVLADDGAGGVLTSTTLGDKSGSLRTDAGLGADFYVVPAGADELMLIAFGGDISTF